jgi:hypothetical protein
LFTLGVYQVKIRLWGKAPGNNYLTPASFSSSLENPDLFYNTLQNVEYGWILTIDPFDPNKLTPLELIEMAKQIIEHNGVKLLSIGEDAKGNHLWLAHNFDQYKERILNVDWSKIGVVAAPPKKEPTPVSTEKRDALAALKTELENKPEGIPAVVKKMAEKYNGQKSIPKPLLTKLEQWYTVVIVDGVYQTTEK